LGLNFVLSDLCKPIQLLLAGVGAGRFCKAVHTRKLDQASLRNIKGLKVKSYEKGRKETVFELQSGTVAIEGYFQFERVDSL
jgi:hypothetical protein